MQPNNKWKFAIGTTSRAPNSGGLHYFIADFDQQRYIMSDDFLCGVLSNAGNIVWQKTPHGWHMYSDMLMRFDKLIETLKLTSADPAWIRIGEKRGYFFLADKSMTVFPWPVERMVLRYGKKEA